MKDDSFWNIVADMFMAALLVFLAFVAFTMLSIEAIKDVLG